MELIFIIYIDSLIEKSNTKLLLNLYLPPKKIRKIKIYLEDDIIIKICSRTEWLIAYYYDKITQDIKYQTVKKKKKASEDTDLRNKKKGCYQPDLSKLV